MLYQPHMFQFVPLLFPRFFLWLARVFLCTFIIANQFFITIFNFVIFVPIWILLRMCSYIFVGNAQAIKIHIIQIQVIFYNVIKKP